MQLRSNNLPTASIPSNPSERRKCQAGCNKTETICHVLQSCPATHWPRIKRHNEIAHKIRDHCRRKTWNTEDEPHIRHQDGTLYKPDLVIHQPNKIIVVDVQVCWEGDVCLATAHARKRAIYNNNKFLEALKKAHPGTREIVVEPITIGARGIWPRCNETATMLLDISHALQASCVHSALKWAATIHQAFGQKVWRRR